MRKISEAGYEGIELWGGQFHGYPLDFLKNSSSLDERVIDLEKISCVRKTADDLNLEMVCFTPEQCVYPINFLARDVYPFEQEIVRRKSLDYFRLSIDVAKHLGIKGIVVTTPFWSWKKSNHDFRIMNRTEVFEQAAFSLKELTAYAEKYGVDLLLEPRTSLGTNAVETLDDTVAMLARIDSPNLKIVLDSGHINVTATEKGEDPKEYTRNILQTLREKIIHVHLDDNCGDIDAHLALGQGNIDFSYLLSELERIDYRGYLSVELSDDGDYVIPQNPETLIRKSRDFLTEIMVSI